MVATFEAQHHPHDIDDAPLLRGRVDTNGTIFHTLCDGVHFDLDWLLKIVMAYR